MTADVTVAVAVVAVVAVTAVAAVGVAVAAIAVRCHVAPRAGQGLTPTGCYLPLVLAYKRQPLPTLATNFTRMSRLCAAARWCAMLYYLLG